MRTQMLVSLAGVALFATFGFVACGDDNGLGPGGCSVDGRVCAIDCDPSVGCVECGGDGDCGAAAPFCVAGECEVCAESSDCAAGQACYPRKHTCEPACTNNGNCTEKDEPLCDTDSGACVGCIDDSSCGGARPICNEVSRRCGECAGDGDCGTAAPYCDVDSGECRECVVDQQCDNGICHDHHCQLRCSENSDCSDPNRPRCQVQSGECVSCLAAADCPAAAPHCAPNGRCTQCLSNADCTTPGLTVCDSAERCVECDDNDQCANGLKCKGNSCRN